MATQKQIGEIKWPGLTDSIEATAKATAWISEHSHELVALGAFGLMLVLFIPSKGRR